MSNREPISAVVSQFGLEINGTLIDVRPKLKHLVERLGYDFRTVTLWCHSWIWDELGITAQSPALGDDPNISEVECLWFTLKAYDLEASGRPKKKGDDVLVRQSFQGNLSVFGFRKSESDDVHTYMRRLLHGLSGLQLALRVEPTASRCDGVDLHERENYINHRTQGLEHGASLVLWDPCPAGPVEINYYFARTRPPEETSAPLVAMTSKATATSSEVPTSTRGITTRQSIGEIAKAETVRIFTQRFWNGGWKIVISLLAVLFAVVALTLWFYVFR